MRPARADPAHFRQKRFSARVGTVPPGQLRREEVGRASSGYVYRLQNVRGHHIDCGRCDGRGPVARFGRLVSTLRTCPAYAVGTSPTPLLGAARRLRAGARRRAVVKRGRLYFVPTHTSPTVPRVRSPAAYLAVAGPRQILPPSEGSSEGKGLIKVISYHRRAPQKEAYA